MNDPTLGQTWPAALTAFASVFLLAVLLVLTKRWHGALTLDHVSGVQKLHTHPTPRVGGLPVLAGIGLAWPLVPAEARALLVPLLLAATPAALFGFVEDLTRRVSVASRLTATLVAGVLFWWLSGEGVTRVDLPLLDDLLRFLPVSLALTAFAIGGMANALNIVDGLNGLAGLLGAGALATFGLIAYGVGDAPLAGGCMLLAAAVLGFWCVNWPFGKIFLGDGGAYFLGFALAAIAILLTERNPAVSPFGALLVCVHPVTEVLFSIWRRKFRDCKPGNADALHLHSLIKRRLVGRLMPRAPGWLRNSASGLLVAAAGLVPATVALLVHRSAVASALAILGYVLGYVAVYARLVRFRWCSPIAFLLVRRAPLHPARH